MLTILKMKEQVSCLQRSVSAYYQLIVTLVLHLQDLNLESQINV